METQLRSEILAFVDLNLSGIRGARVYKVVIEKEGAFMQRQDY